MSTKNLARTLIEGGRAGYNKWQRWESHHQERALARTYLSRAAQREDGFDGLSIGKRPKVYKGFADKLGPPRRWLRSHVGRPWNKVRAEMFDRFDPRSLAGQHILFDHLLLEVRMWGDDRVRYRWRDSLFVDAHGILREAPGRPRKPPRLARGKQRRSEREVVTWAANRRVGGYGEALYWYVVAHCCPACKGATCCCPHVDGKLVHGPHVHYRQGHALSETELAFWNSLVDCVQLAYAFPETRGRAKAST